MSQQENPKYLWWNHRIIPWEEATVHLTDYWWASVTAVFEVISGYWNNAEGEMYIFRLEDHARRLEQSMQLIRMPKEFTVDEICQATIDLVRANDYRGDVFIMPLAYAVGNKAFRVVGDRTTEMFIYSRPAVSRLEEDFSLHACYSSWTRINERVLPPRIKALANYRNSQLASSEAAMNGYDTALFLNPEGKVAEGTGSCVFFVRKGKLITPDITSGILESITRDTVIHLAREVLGLEVEERVVDRTETYLADEAFLCGTHAEITPIASIDRHEMKHGAPGPITRQLRDIYREVVYGRDFRYRNWLTPVGMGVRAEQ
uniref:Branched-chain-amino-acid aminotransferase n=1 Tax=Thermobaculum terrenum (strain ATCC BAA-798 / CCMEE 7001 / YNP1) TaxID=525904 RepID=UPI001C31EAB4|nr:Chain A, Branched-chain-amino-acid aminotransferase [Thermobaculum terrenum ATCC BAA-798]